MGREGGEVSVSFVLFSSRLVSYFALVFLSVRLFVCLIVYIHLTTRYLPWMYPSNLLPVAVRFCPFLCDRTLFFLPFSVKPSHVSVIFLMFNRERSSLSTTLPSPLPKQNLLLRFRRTECDLKTTTTQSASWCSLSPCLSTSPERRAEGDEKGEGTLTLNL